VQQEKRWVIKELLGIDVPLDLLPSSGSRDYHAFEIALGNLPVDKRDAVQALQESYWQQSDALKAKYDKKRTSDFTAESRQLSDSLRQELAKILSPQELEDYEIRTSSEAKQLSTKLASYFRPSEDEFRKIYRAKRENAEAMEKLTDQPLVFPPTATQEERQALQQQHLAQIQAQQQARAAANTQMEQQLKGALGDDRYAEFQRSQDRTYDLLARLGIRYDVPQDKVLEAYQAQKAFESDISRGNQGAGTPPPDRAELQRQLNEKLATILGEQAARGYRRVRQN
jgi:hypothetical protein